MQQHGYVHGKTRVEHDGKKERAEEHAVCGCTLDPIMFIYTLVAVVAETVALSAETARMRPVGTDPAATTAAAAAEDRSLAFLPFWFRRASFMLAAPAGGGGRFPGIVCPP